MVTADASQAAAQSVGVQSVGPPGPAPWLLWMQTARLASSQAGCHGGEGAAASTRDTPGWTQLRGRGHPPALHNPRLPGPGGDPQEESPHHWSPACTWPLPGSWGCHIWGSIRPRGTPWGDGERRTSDGGAGSAWQTGQPCLGGGMRGPRGAVGVNGGLWQPRRAPPTAGPKEGPAPPPTNLSPCQPRQLSAPK